MNNEYNYIKNSGVVSVKDENDNPRLVEYSDNLEDILATENIVEELENEIEKNKDFEKDLKYKKFYLFGNFLIFIFTTILFVTSESWLLFCSLTPLLIAVCTFMSFRYSKDVTTFNKRKSYLNEQLKLAKFKLKTLRKNKSKVNEQEITQNQETQKVTSHIEYLNQLKSYLKSLNGTIPTTQPEIDYSEGLQDKTKKLSIK